MSPRGARDRSPSGLPPALWAARVSDSRSTCAGARLTDRRGDVPEHVQAHVHRAVVLEAELGTRPEQRVAHHAEDIPLDHVVLGEDVLDVLGLHQRAREARHELLDLVVDLVGAERGRGLSVDEGPRLEPGRDGRDVRSHLVLQLARERRRAALATRMCPCAFNASTMLVESRRERLRSFTRRAATVCAGWRYLKTADRPCSGSFSMTLISTPPMPLRDDRARCVGSSGPDADADDEAHPSSRSTPMPTHHGSPLILALSSSLARRADPTSLISFTFS